MLVATLLLPLLLVGMRGLCVPEANASIPLSLVPTRTTQSLFLCIPPAEGKAL